MRLLLSLVALVLITCFAGCETVQVEVDHDPTASFSDLKTYYWAPISEKDTGNVLATDPIVNARLRNSVDKKLSSMGFIKQTSDTPDFYVGAFVTINNRTSVSQVNSYYSYGSGWGHGYTRRQPSGYGGYGGSQRYVYHYQEGTLIIDISRTDNKQLIWRATANGELDTEPAEQEKKDKRLDELIGKMFKDFPPEDKK